ncbi:hypothetical protein [Pantoea sp. C2G6]|uniref:hypothetical protein n=1 Tax=Pantoea sp. C2G6 TaxID=3243084 RepID=UPI003EDAE2A2
MTTLKLKKILRHSMNDDATSDIQLQKLKAYTMQPLTEEEINNLMEKAVEKYNRENSRDIFKDDY